jgi:hypothetical protein
MISGELLDPRPIEKVLNTSSAISQSCVIGNRFLGSAAEFICLLIKPTTSNPNAVITSQITRAVASINRTLAPPLRIAWSRVLILNEDQEVPYTSKRMIFRKKLEDMFGGQLARLLGNEDNQEQPAKAPDHHESPRWSKVDVMDKVLKAVADALQISITVLKIHPESSFADVRIFISQYSIDSIMHTYFIFLSLEWTQSWPLGLSTSSTIFSSSTFP